MSNKLYPYHYDRQFEKFIGQFMRVFGGLQYFTGQYDQSNEPITKKIPIVYGTSDRVVTRILNKDESRFSNYTLPMMAVNLVNVSPDIDNRRTKYHRDVVSNEGKVSGEKKVVNRLVGKPMNMQLNVNVIASSQVQLFSIVEQLLLIFNPRITVNFSSDAWDVDNTSEISLTSVNNEITYPIGTQSSMVEMSFDFEMPVRLEYPRNLTDKFIDQIQKSVFPVSEENATVDTSGIEETIDEGDA